MGGDLQDCLKTGKNKNPIAYRNLKFWIFWYFQFIATQLFTTEQYPVDNLERETLPKN